MFMWKSPQSGTKRVGITYSDFYTTMSSRVSLFFYTFFLLFSVYPQESFYHFIYIYQSELTQNMQNIYELDRNYLNIW